MIASFFLLLLGGVVWAQKADSVQRAPLTVSGYVELFYAYDFANPHDHRRQAFLYNHNRHHELNLNLGFLKAHYETPGMRANLALMAGTYAQDNLAAEPESLRAVYEANIGVRLSQAHNLWLDAGILPSHIGWETAVGKDNVTLSRSLAAENSPYFETGARLSYTSPNGRWFLSGLVLNGWQRISRPPGSEPLAFGHQITYTPNEHFSLNSSSFVGNDKPTAEKRMRYFHDLYAVVKPTSRVTAIFGLDTGAEQKEKGSQQHHFWFSPNILAKYQMNEKVGLGGRIEYFQDRGGVIIAQPADFRTWGFSLNLDYQVHPQVLWRTEVRNFTAPSALFTDGEGLSRQNWTVGTTLAAWF